MLIKATRPNPNSIAEDEKFEITYSLDFPSQQKKVRYTKIHTLGVSSLCGLATIAEYIIRRPFRERMAIYKNILKYAPRKNLVDPADPANPANPVNPELKLDKNDPRYFLLVEQFQEARNEALKKFIKNDISSIKPNSSSAGAVSDSVSASVLAQYIRETSDLQMKKIKESLAKLDQNDAELYQSTYYQVFSNTDESVDVIAFDEFKKLFQVKSIPEIFEFANDRANILKGDEGVESQTVSFFTAYFNKDNSCQLWIINLLQNYADQVNDVMRSKIPETEDYSTEFLEVFFKLAINEVFPNEVDEFVPYDNDTSTEKCYTRRFINIQKSDTFYSPIYTTGSQQAINSTDCIYAGGSRSAGAGHYSYCQREGEKKFPEPTEDLARIVGPEELVAQASDVAGHLQEFQPQPQLG